jgi:hypothetical protein
LLNEPKRTDNGELLKAFQAIEQYRAKLGRIGPGGHPSKSQTVQAVPRLELWAQGFTVALDELEESKHCADSFGRLVKSVFVEDMAEEERDAYRRYLYFYKNAFIRVFSVLDKLGYFLDELYSLGTGRVKPRFSYFTVLRQMHEKKIETELEQKLFVMRKKYEEPLRRLRSQRNMEIHLLNAEMVDDMLLAKSATHRDGRQKVENLPQNLSDLAAGYEMACNAVEAVFVHAKNSARS